MAVKDKQRRAALNLAAEAGTTEQQWLEAREGAYLLRTESDSKWCYRSLERSDADRLPLALPAIAVCSGFCARLSAGPSLLPSRPSHIDPPLADAKPGCGQAQKHFVASLSLPSTMRFSSPASAFSIFASKRLRMAFSLSFRPAVRHKM